MRILFDNGVPDGLLHFLEGHAVELARRRGWAQISNGELLAVTEEEDFDVLITTDRDFLYQQNLSHRQIGVIFLRNFRWPISPENIQRIRSATDVIKCGELIELRLYPNDN